MRLPNDAQTWTRLDKKSQNLPHSGPLWKTVLERTTIDDITGHIMSLEYTKHMSGKDVHRCLPTPFDM